MKVLMVNTVVTDPNGIAQVIFNINDYIDHSNLQIDLVSINDPDSRYYEKIQKYGGRIFVVKRSVSHALCYIFRLSTIIRKNHYDIVHAHGNSSTLMLEMLAAWIAGCKVRIAHSHNTTCSNILLHKILNGLFNALCTNRFACGKDAGEWLFRRRNFTIINNGINTEKFAYSSVKRKEIRRLLQIDDETIIAGHVGFFNTQKNQVFLLDIIHKLYNINPNVKFVLIGDGPDRDMVYNKIKNLGLEKIIICTGLVHNVEDYLSAMDLIIMPSLYEGLPVALIEEQASGLQCFISDTITREVDKTGNIVFIPLSQSSEEWARKINSLYRKDIDRDFVSAESIMKISNLGYSIQTESQKLLEYYKRQIK